MFSWSQCSANSPFSTLQMSMDWKFTGRPLAGMPRNVPWWVALYSRRAATRSPSPTASCSTAFRSGKALNTWVQKPRLASMPSATPGLWSM